MLNWSANQLLPTRQVGGGSLNGKILRLLRCAWLCAACIAMSYSPAMGEEVPAEPQADEFITVSDDAAPPPTDTADDAEPQVAGESATAPVESRRMRPIAESKSAESDGIADDESALADEPVVDEVAPIDDHADAPAAGDATKSVDAYPNTADNPAASAGNATPRPQIDPATFRGVVAGETSRDELLAEWGDEAVRSTNGGNELTYQFKPFKQVVVKLVDEKVDTVVIHLEASAEPAPLAKQLQLDDTQATTIYNEKGQKLGMAFPERGVLFAFAPQAPIRVAQVVLEPVNSQPFVTRAEEFYFERPAAALADVEFAIEIDPQYDRAHAVHAKVLYLMGDYAAAQTAIERACKLTPNEPEYQLVRAQTYLSQQDYAAAVDAAKSVAGKNVSAHLLSQSELVQGHALAQQSEPDFAKALAHHTAAIKHAQQAAAVSTGPVRQRLKELAIDAHLAVANDIACGNWQQKEKIVPQWIERAKAISDHIIDKEGAAEISRLQVYAGSLRAYANLKSPPDANETIDAMTSLGRRLLEGETLENRREQLHFQLANALADGMTIASARGNHTAAQQLGQQSVKHFEQAQATCKERSDYTARLAEVYYRLGAMSAIEQEDHDAAMAWYRQAVPLLTEQTKSASGLRAVRLGETLVSIAISYWETNERDEALQLTEQGAQLIATAVEAGLVKREALAVPYGNMAAMHEAIGSNKKAQEFSEMATKATIRR